MKKIPRASLCITLLTDEDFRLLMATPGGLEAFGVFVAMLIVGRERLQEEKATQIEGTESLRLSNGLFHIASLAQIQVLQLERAVAILASVAEATGAEPWMYIDDTERLVIRSFFKFNVKRDWGGPRPGAGRPPKKKPPSGNQDNQDFQVVNHLNTSRIPSHSLSLSLSTLAAQEPPLPPGGQNGRGGGGSRTPAEILEITRAAEDAICGFGRLTENACKAYPPAWVDEAVRLTVAGGGSYWGYTEKILKRFKAQGYPDSEKPQTLPSRASPRAAPKQETPEETKARHARTMAMIDRL